MRPRQSKRKILCITCPDTKGLISKITSICFMHDLNIVQNDEYVDPNNSRFFMRTELEGSINDKAFLLDLKTILPEETVLKIHYIERHRIVILVTKESHCLGDLLIKSTYGDLNVEISAVISNHETLRSLVERFNIPFYTISHKKFSREEHDMHIMLKIDSFKPDYVVLAKYMRVLTPTFVHHYPNKIINIHHSFLPAFIGARPYHQAYKRGVKIIGATAHYVSEQVDEGPIIIQDVTHIDHTYTPEDMIRAGQDVEKNALSWALHYVLDHRVFVYDNKTIIF